MHGMLPSLLVQGPLVYLVIFGVMGTLELPSEEEARPLTITTIYPRALQPPPPDLQLPVLDVAVLGSLCPWVCLSWAGTTLSCCCCILHRASHLPGQVPPPCPSFVVGFEGLVEVVWADWAGWEVER